MATALCIVLCCKELQHSMAAEAADQASAQGAKQDRAGRRDGGHVA